MGKILKTSVDLLKIKAAYFIFIITITPFYAQGNQMDLFSWFPTESADARYPTQIIKGDFLFSDGSSIYIPNKRVISNGWGNIGSIHLVGKKDKPVPDKLRITWLSFTENIFYSGMFDLPTEKIASMFRKGFLGPVTESHETYGKIIVGLGLEGWISVWLGGGGIVHEAAIFRANPAEIEWSLVTNNRELSREKYIKRVLLEYFKAEEIQKIEKAGPEKGVWEKYLERLPWNIVTRGTSTPLNMWLRTFNGERVYYDLIRNKLVEENRSVPKEMEIAWQNPTGQKYKAHIVMNEQEIMRAFEKIFSIKEKGPVRFIIEIGNQPKSIALSIRNDHYVIVLEKYGQNIFANSR
ncbi:MAG: DUF2931 family protein [Magnetococcus sp. DMHC-1]